MQQDLNKLIIETPEKNREPKEILFHIGKGAWHNHFEQIRKR